MGEALWRCGLSLQQSSKLVAILDILFGTLSTVLVTIYFEKIKNHFKSARKNVKKSGRHQPLPPEFAMVMLVISAAQIIFGGILYIGAAKKIRRICQFWMVEVILTSFLLCNFIPRLYGLIVVAYFCQELKVDDEEDPADFIGESTIGDCRELGQAPIPGTQQPPIAPPGNTEAFLVGKG